PVSLLNELLVQRGPKFGFVYQVELLKLVMCPVLKDSLNGFGVYGNTAASIVTAHSVISAAVRIVSCIPLVAIHDVGDGATVAVTPRTRFPQLEDGNTASLAEDGSSLNLERNGDWLLADTPCPNPLRSASQQLWLLKQARRHINKSRSPCRGRRPYV